ncbi:MAG: hypothetical protein ABSG41_15265 [Bryobacteraceae bacterium]|jgi:hypothetical protein
MICHSTKTAALLTAALLAGSWTARADFSYTTTRKMTGGSLASLAAGNNQNSKTWFKGQKMRNDNGDTAVILDFDAQTITTINNKQKTVTVMNFSDINVGGRQSNLTAKIDVKETGQKKTINGYNASELMMTMEMDGPANSPMGKMQMEIDMWISPDAPGVGEMRAFYQRNASRFPWTALAGGNQGMQAGMAELQRKMAEMNGVPVLQVMKMTAAGGGAAAPAVPQMSPDQMAKMKDAMARLQAMQSQGGPAAAAAQQALARMGAATGSAPGSGAGSGSLMEMTMESTDFSTGSIPDSVFAIPADYQKVSPK